MKTGRYITFIINGQIKAYINGFIGLFLVSQPSLSTTIGASKTTFRNIVIFLYNLIYAYVYIHVGGGVLWYLGFGILRVKKFGIWDLGGKIIWDLGKIFGI